LYTITKRDGIYYLLFGLLLSATGARELLELCEESQRAGFCDFYVCELACEAGGAVEDDDVVIGGAGD